MRWVRGERRGRWSTPGVLIRTECRRSFSDNGIAFPLQWSFVTRWRYTAARLVQWRRTLRDGRVIRIASADVDCEATPLDVARRGAWIDVVLRATSSVPYLRNP